MILPFSILGPVTLDVLLDLEMTFLFGSSTDLFLYPRLDLQGAFGKLGHGNRLAQSTPKVVVALQGGRSGLPMGSGSGDFLDDRSAISAIHRQKDMFLFPCGTKKTVNFGMLLSIIPPDLPTWTVDRQTCHPSVLGTSSLRGLDSKGRSLHLGSGGQFLLDSAIEKSLTNKKELDKRLIIPTHQKNIWKMF